LESFKTTRFWGNSILGVEGARRGWLVPATISEPVLIAGHMDSCALRGRAEEENVTLIF